MTSWIFLLIQLVFAVGASFGFWVLLRLTLRVFRERKTAEGIGLSLASLAVALVAIFFILAVIGGIIRVS